jgi:hypothetical protein
MITTYAEGSRIYATETIRYAGFYQDGYQDHVVRSSDEGVVVELTGDDAYDLLIEWDAGFLGSVNSGSVALVDPEARVCANTLHDHSTTVLPDGTEVTEPVPMACSHDGEPAHYDMLMGIYCHDDPDVPTCFLMGPNFVNPCAPKG